MGVKGLWKLIEEAGTRVNVDSLEGKTLAIDLSIWINQAIKGFRDRDGRAVSDAHLLGLFYRLCKLLFYRIRPIVVFDGQCPQLKQYTVLKRAEKTRKTATKSKQLSLNVLEHYISSQLGQSTDGGEFSQLQKKAKFVQRTEFASELLLPHTINHSKQVDVYQSFGELTDECKNRISDDEEKEETEPPYHHPKHQNLHEVDINSEHFKSLPPVTRYEILVELRESYKNRKTISRSLMPQESHSFSQFQLAKLLKKRDLQREIEKLIEELNGQAGRQNMEMMELDPAILASGSISTGTLASDEKTRFLLLKTLNQAMEEFADQDEEQDFEAKKEEEKEEEVCSSQDSAVYRVPNSLPGQDAIIDSHLERIEFLARESAANQEPMAGKAVSRNIDRNVRKYCSEKGTADLVLSDQEEEEEESSTDNEGFIEVSPGPYEDEDASLPVFDEFDVPYDTSYSMNIVVKNQEAGHEEPPMAADTRPENPERIDDHQEEVAPLEEMSEPNPNDDIVKEESNIIAPEEPERPVPNPEQLVQDGKEAAKLDRQATSVTDQMVRDCQELLRLFGIPWVVAPAEAEAQCAALEELGLCEGIITDDSDVFLFGGRRVYRNFFTNAKFIMKYSSEDLVKYYGLDRSKFICLGMLCGTDYTLGIENVGPVVGMEILAEFPGNGLEPLTQFARWYRDRIFVSDGVCRPENGRRAMFLRLELPPNFPSRAVFEAYHRANVDLSTEQFSWSMPQLSELRRFAVERFGWPEAKTDAFLLPVLKNMNAKQKQKRIDWYFSPVAGVQMSASSNQNAISEKLKIKRSKRLNAAIRKNIRLATIGKSDPGTNKRKRKQSVAGPQLVLSEESSGCSD